MELAIWGKTYTLEYLGFMGTSTWSGGVYWDWMKINYNVCVYGKKEKKCIIADDWCVSNSFGDNNEALWTEEEDISGSGFI